MAPPPIKALFVDAGKTLFTERSSRAAIYAQIAHEFGGCDDAASTQESMSRAFEELPKLIDGCFRFSLGWFQSFNARIFEEQGVPQVNWGHAHERAVAVFEDPATYRLFDEVPSFLKEVRERGLQIGIVSNWSERLPLLCQGLEIDGLVDFVVASADIRCEKPERKCFHRALFRAGVRDAETVHIGDSLSRDVKGARDAGLRAVLLDRSADFDNRERDGVLTVSSLSALLPLLPATAAQGTGAA